MLIIFKKTFILNSLLVLLVILISILTIHWHHKMYLLHEDEKIVKAKYDHFNAINRQLLMEYSELESGVLIYQRSTEELLMFLPQKNQVQDVSI